MQKIQLGKTARLGLHSTYTEEQELPVIIIIIQYLYSVLKSCKGYEDAGGFRLRLSEQVCFEVFLEVCKA